jgi:hypothetical protein
MSEWLQVPEDVSSIIGAVDTIIQKNEVSKSSRGYETYHPSSFGNCLRLMQYLRYADMGLISVNKEIVESRMIRLWDVGHSCQSRWEDYFTQMGVLRGYWKCANENCSTIFGQEEKRGIFKPKNCSKCGYKKMYYEEVLACDKELNISGHADMILDFSNFDRSIFNGTSLPFSIDKLPQKPVVVDMKTCNCKSWSSQVTRIGPHFYYQVQLTIYTNLLDCEFGVLIYEKKDDSSVKAFKIPKREDTWYQEIRRQAKMMNEMISLKKLPPPRQITKDNYECGRCPFMTCCHKSKVWDDEEKLKEQRRAFYGNLLDAH